MEIWKDIKEYPGYQVSNMGKVRTYNKTTHTQWHGDRKWQNRILQQKCQIKKNGRKDYRVNLWKNGKPHTLLVARLVAFTFNNIPLDSKLTTNHIDGNSANNNINNLEVISQKENVLHAFRNNLTKTQIKIKIEDKQTGTLIYPSSLNEGNKYINKNHSYLSTKIKENVFENDRYRWELI